MTRVAAIDCGTNSIRLLVADVADGVLRDVERRMEVVRLGHGVDRTGELAPEAIDRTVAAARRYAEVCRRHGVERIRFVATSASRDARNRQDFVDGVVAALGVEPEVVDGHEEAELSFRGATAAIGTTVGGIGTTAGTIGATAGQWAPYLVVDLGGGSTELVLGTHGPEAAWSMDVGCVRMTERHLAGDPPTAAQIEAARDDVRAALDEAARHVPLARTGTLVGLAGSVTTVTAHALGLQRYDADVIDGATLTPSAVLDAAEDLLLMPRERRADLGFMHPGRVDVIGAGALVWQEVVRRVEAEVQGAGRRLADVVTSEHDILDGIALGLAE